MDLFRRKKPDEEITLASLSPLRRTLITTMRSPTKLSDYRILSTLGTGTFGRVRLVQHLATGEYHALKILKKSEILRLQQFHHIKYEVLILSSIQHPFIVNYINHFQDERCLYIILEYIQGGELFSYLRREGRLHDSVARAYISQLVLALSYLHNMDIIYRDLKPENLLITYRGYLKITDFGFAKQIKDRTWTLCGTPEYLAPEIIQSKGHGKSVDWWALGILLFEMLAGYPPFYDENPFGIYQKILKGKIDFPKQIDSKTRDLIKRLLCQDRTKRLGCLRAGAEDIKKHKYFAKVDWVAYYNQQAPMAYIPNISGPGDRRHFDEYPDSPIDRSVPLSEEEKLAFLEFDKI